MPYPKNSTARWIVYVPITVALAFASVSVFGSIGSELYGSAPRAEASPEVVESWCARRLIGLHAELEERMRLALRRSWVRDREPGVGDAPSLVSEGWKDRWRESKKRCSKISERGVGKAYDSLRQLRSRYQKTLTSLRRARWELARGIDATVARYAE